MIQVLDYLYNLPNSTSGLDVIATDTITAVPSLTPLILLFVFFTVWLGGVFRQKARTETSDYALWCTIAGLMTFVVTLIMSIISGFINLDYLAVVIAVTIFAGFWLFYDRKASEM